MSTPAIKLQVIRPTVFQRVADGQVIYPGSVVDTTDHRLVRQLLGTPAPKFRRVVDDAKLKIVGRDSWLRAVKREAKGDAAAYAELLTQQLATPPGPVPGSDIPVSGRADDIAGFLDDDDSDSDAGDDEDPTS